MINCSEHIVTPLEIINSYYSDGQSFGNRENKLWQKMNSLLTWDNILNKGYQSDLCPLLYFIITKVLPRTNSQILHNKLASKEMVPDSILLQLKEHYNSSLARNMILLEELKQVVQKLKENDIKVIVLKGAHLAENVYENIACRPMGDLDILVREEDREKSYKILLSLGYNKVPESHQDKMLHRSFSSQLMGQKVIIEIHHRLVKEIFMTKFDFEGIWGIDHIPIESQIVYLSWHMIHHGIRRLLWLCDVAEIIKNNKKDINWDIVCNKSVNFNVQKQLMLSQYLTSILIYPSFSNNSDSQFSFSMRCVSEILFQKIQKKVLNQDDEKELRHLLGITLMKAKDLKTYIPQYIRYRLS